MTGQAHEGVSLACAGRGYLDDALPSDDVRQAWRARARTQAPARSCCLRQRMPASIKPSMSPSNTESGLPTS